MHITKTSEWRPGKLPRRMTLTLILSALLGICSSGFAGTGTYYYDELGRLIKVDHPDGRVTTYGLDGTGNRTTVATTLANSPGTLQWAQPTYSLSEVGISISIVASRVNGSAGAVAVSYSLSGTASGGGIDYSASGTLSWADGVATSQSVTINVVDDTIYENPDETVILTLNSPTNGATLGSPTVTTLTILNNDPLPDTTPPTDPSGLGATATSSTNVNLGWTGSTDSGGSGLANYRIERCLTVACSWVESKRLGNHSVA